MSSGAIQTFADSDWTADGPTRGVEAQLEGGGVLVLPHLAFDLLEAERRFLDPHWSDGRAKNISVRWPGGELRGARGQAADLEALRAMITRFAEHGDRLALRLFPHYRGALRRAGTSFRPLRVETRTTSVRKDDARLHVDAFPSNPTRGTRILRVFNNLNPHGEARCWRVGEPFESHAAHFLPAIPRPVPGSAALLNLLHVTKRRRTEYDHLMLQLHDRAKADDAYQRDSPQTRVEFAPGTIWICFSDQVPHAVMSGQFMLEQTMTLDVERQQDQTRSPLRILERLTGRPLR